ncbi:nitrous oxide reductase accessory protein NosL [Defluviimonas salinarum]|uniref:Nitrous oxide reductase accessory protein NosL n=1 Tax=Defluviimonas salinarum TaxID=2992147 RepID=A0ABT3J8N4_9RHOB|nr:nitrous oxide reductase accessory protein NosL [Defluviimonas salinarum]MCW3784020.1 nitrous oxide reductase accessory protein NosL [Defluviimonas salinarum]
MKRILIATLLLAACKEEVAVAPDPVSFTDETLAHFCAMNVAEHGGPKGQIHLEGIPEPLFFAQVRDAVAYLKSPERDAAIVATYVTDMGKAASWDEPGPTNWTAADTAVFVVEAEVAGGMGAPEIVPFADPAEAEAFISRYGGRAVPLAEIPDEAALAPIDLDAKLETPS